MCNILRYVTLSTIGSFIATINMLTDDFYCVILICGGDSYEFFRKTTNIKKKQRLYARKISQ